MGSPNQDCFEINGRKIGAGLPTYIIAELSGNHGQNYDHAVELVHAAHQAGADAIKLQTYTADTLTIRSDQEYFRVGQGLLWSGQTLHDLYQQAYTPWEWQPKLKQLANSLGMDLFSTPFDASAVEFLEQMQVPAHKIASFETVDFPLLRLVARTGKPVIMSTGMCTQKEIQEAVDTLSAAGCKQLALLKCTSAYPARPEEMNLRTIPHLRETFGTAVGLSDHTLDLATPVAAVTLGACIIEKHFTLSRKTPGPDNGFSLEPAEFKSMVEQVRVTEKALGRVQYQVSPEESKSVIFRRSLFVVEDVAQGQRFTEANVRSIRPGHGLHTKYLEELLGKTAARDVKRGTPMSWELVEGIARRNELK